MEAKRRLAFSILDFLKQSNEDGTIKPDDVEGVDVAIQCLGEAFGVNPEDPEQVAKYTTKPATLLSIFDVFLKTQQKVAASKATGSAAPKQAELTEEQKSEAEAFKADGNKKLTSKAYDEAIELYGKAIAINPNNAVYYSNRAAAYSQQGDHQKAADDARKAAEVDPKFSKAYSRLGHAYFCLGLYQESVDAYKKGLELEPGNAAMKSSLQTAETRLASAAGSSPSSAVETTQSADSRSSARSAPAAGGMPDLASMLGGGAGGGMPDIASMMQNPAMMRMAQQAMQNPEMMRMAQQMMGGGGGGAGGAGGLADIMNNPDMMNMARQFMGGMGGGGAGGNGGSS